MGSPNSPNKTPPPTPNETTTHDTPLRESSAQGAMQNIQTSAAHKDRLTQSLSERWLPSSDNMEKSLPKGRKPPANGRECDLYKWVALRLNQLSQYITQQKNYDVSVVFLVTSDKPLLGNFLDKKMKPDIVAFTCKTADFAEYMANTKKNPAPVEENSRSWCRALGTLELKTKKPSEAQPQIFSYVSTNKTYRVDLSYTLGLAGSRSGFYLYALSPNQMESYEHMGKWEDTSLLLRYVLGLYRCHQTKDPNIECLSEGRRVQIWKCRIKGHDYVVSPFVARSCPGRNTWVAGSVPLTETTEAKKDVVVKIYWHDDLSREHEGQMYDRVKGVAGVMHPIDFEISPGVDNVTWGNQLRQKCYLVTDQIGRPLSQCRSLKGFLETMLDLLDVLDDVHAAGVLHRDVSWFNVLLTLDRPEQDSNRKDPGTDPVKRRKVILGDFDQAIPKSKAPKGRVERTGTPMFVAREISGPGITRYTKAGDLIYTFGGRKAFLNLKQHAVGKREKRAVRRAVKMIIKTDNDDIAKRQAEIIEDEDDEDDDSDEDEDEGDIAKVQAKKAASAIAGALNPITPSQQNAAQVAVIGKGESTIIPVIVRLIFRDPDPTPNSTGQENKPQDRVTYQERHDMESVFWIMAWFLTRAWPETGEDVDSVHAYQSWVHTMLRHRILPHRLDEERDSYLFFLQDNWRSLLHPRLQFLARLLAAIAGYVSMDWRGSAQPSPAILKSMIRMELDNIGTADVTFAEKPRPAGQQLVIAERRTYTSTQLLASIPASSSNSNVNNNSRKRAADEDQGSSKRRRRDAGISGETESFCGSVEDPSSPSAPASLADDGLGCKELNSVQSFFLSIWEELGAWRFGDTLWFFAGVRDSYVKRATQDVLLE